MQAHWHLNIEDVLIYGVSAIVVINLARIASAKLVTRGGKVGDIGRAIGAVVA